MAISNKTKFQPNSDELVKESAPAEWTYEPEVVLIRNLMDAKVKMTGVTGTVYEWSKAGAVVKVFDTDKDEILNKKRGRSCCGGMSGKPLFELVEE